MKTLLHTVACITGLLLPAAAGGNILKCQQPVFSGQAIGWTTLNPSGPFQAQTGIRYLPELSFSLPAGKLTLDGEFSANIWGTGTAYGIDSLQADGEITPYRMWLRLSGKRFELRAGLQKINFGSAQLFRPLMWFDRIDPRDPLQLTDGVYGVLARYYFENNANIWLWGLYGEEKTKGWEVFPSVQGTAEYGGRVQVPLFTGEVAATYHHRTAGPSAILPDSLGAEDRVPENRLGLDAKVDLGVGLWAEAALIRQSLEISPLDYTTMLNLGLDYTFGWGNGLHAMSEGFAYLRGESPFGNDEELCFGLLSVNYPISIIHNLGVMLFYDFTNGDLYRFANWSITYDRWSFYVMGFWNPSAYSLYNIDARTSLYGGWGFQLMAVFNH